MTPRTNCWTCRWASADASMCYALTGEAEKDRNVLVWRAVVEVHDDDLPLQESATGCPSWEAPPPTELRLLVTRLRCALAYGDTADLDPLDVRALVNAVEAAEDARERFVVSWRSMRRLLDTGGAL